MNPRIDFIQTEALTCLTHLKSQTPANWGLMSPQHMVEHLADFINLSSGKINMPIAVPEDQVPLYRAFLFSDKQFRENTKAPKGVMPETPGACRFNSLEEALADLRKALDGFFNYFKDDTLKTTLHPAFGHLNFEEWLVLHEKHLRHHLRQFSLLPE
jgi:hypothetical protein